MNTHFSLELSFSLSLTPNGWKNVGAPASPHPHLIYESNK